MEDPIVIMGAGLAGMATAKLLTGQGRKVVLIDQSFDPVAQSEQLHVLLSRGQELLKEFFPEVYREISNECPEVNWGSEIYWRSPAGAFPQRNIDVSTSLLSRSYLDQLLIEDLRGNPNCELVKAKISDLSFTEDKGSVKSVTLADRSIACSVCIDSMGRGSRTVRSLEREFSRAVRVDEMKTTLRYFSFIGHRKSPGDFKQVYFQIDPQKERYGGVISPIEGDRVIATFITIDGEFELDGNPFHLIEDEVFQKFLQGVEFEPGHKAFGQLHNRHHRFEKYPDLPSNLFFLGDSVCQFNPVFGQGMTVALESADLLGKFLEDGSGRKSVEFQSLLAKTIRFPWLISTMDPYNDQSPRRITQRITRAFMHRVMLKAQSDSQTHESLIRVLHMLASPIVLLRFRSLC
jgi:2-polyprenyl-6-methoxyphenol hydroxylase-like FAD-dependent oxidoreductase